MSPKERAMKRIIDQFSGLDLELAKRRIQRPWAGGCPPEEKVAAFIAISPGKDRQSLHFHLDGRKIWDDLEITHSPKSFQAQSHDPSRLARALANCRQILMFTAKRTTMDIRLVFGEFFIEEQDVDLSLWAAIAKHWQA